MTFLVVFDTETTGINTSRDDIVELASVLHRAGEKTHSRFCTNALPMVRVGKEAEKVHGWSYEMLEKIEASPSSTVSKLWWEGVKKRANGDEIVLCCHNAKFDIAMMEKHIPSIPDFPYICTYIAASRLYPHNTRHTLECLYKDLGCPVDPSLTAHSAMSDCIMAFRILQQIQKITGKTYAELAKWCMEPEYREVWPIGKEYKGLLTKEVPTSFLQWCLTKEDTMMADVVYTAKLELAERGVRPI